LEGSPGGGVGVGVVGGSVVVADVDKVVGVIVSYCILISVLNYAPLHRVIKNITNSNN
jgi:hypothetical protein